MTALVERDGAFALKIFAAGNAPVAELVLALTAKLRQAGVPVPETSKDSSTGGLRQPWIDGPTLKEALAASGPVLDVKSFTHHRRKIRGAMAALAKLHQAKACTGEVPRFEPFRLIDRRLENFPLGGLSPENRRLALGIRIELEARLSGFDAMGLIHGDLHAGQLVQDHRTGAWWLLDLDDVSLGPPEADIGNFCAHVASTPAITGTDICMAFSTMTALCREAYGGALETGMIRNFGAASLTRRALKYVERHGPPELTAQMLHAAQQLLR
jgi:aminoglycoside phosphotransferase (APT) family kinase protein